MRRCSSVGRRSPRLSYAPTGANLPRSTFPHLLSPIQSIPSHASECAPAPSLRTREGDMVRRVLPGLLTGLVFLSGCLYPVSEKVDGVVCHLALEPRDLQPFEHAALPPPVEEKPEKIEK